MGVVVAMDGPSGSGKSSTSRGVAARLGLRYLDTGAMFRAMTWWMLEHGVDVEDPQAVAAQADAPRARLRHRPAGADDHRRRHRRRRPDPRAGRDQRRQRGQRRPGGPHPAAARAARRSSATADIVVEGRDIGTVVAPDADVKVYLTADPAARAARRTAEQSGADVAATEQDLLRRDAIDSGRATAPLPMADDALHIDTTPFTLDEVVEQVVALVQQARATSGT